MQKGINEFTLFRTSGCPPKLDFSIKFFSRFKVQCCKGSTKVPIRDIITSFDATLKSYSQIRKILEKVTDYPIDLKSEQRSISHELEKLAET